MTFTTGPTEELSALETRTLVLMRHAQSGHPGGVRDHDRPLTDGGWAAATVAGDWLWSHLDPIDEILCSTALRARQTAVATGLTAPIRSEEELYDADPEDILRVLRTTGEPVRTLLVVGHAPGIPALTAQLTAADGDPGAVDPQLRFPTAALTVLQFDGEWAQLDEGAARLTFHRIPPA